MTKFLKIFTITVLSIIAAGIISVLLVFYGPLTGVRDLVVTSAMTTLKHQYIAKWFLSDSDIREIMDRNSIQEPDENSNIDGIKVSKEEVAARNNIQLVNVSKKGLKGYLMIIDNPASVGVGTAGTLPKRGQTVDKIVEKYNAAGGINAGGFLDQGGNGTGGIPEGMLIENGRVVYMDKSKTYNIIGFNRDNVLVLGSYTSQQIQKLNIRDAVSFHPFLIINGVPAITKGNGGWGLAPRTAIGQTRDGKVLMLVIDGRQLGSIGATMKDVQDILLQYGAYNAANLDGGASATMVYDDKTINHPYSSYGSREVPSAFIIKRV